MTDPKTQLEESRKKLAELNKSRSKANCSSKYSSELDVRRETEIEELEETIEQLEAKLKGGG